MLVGITASVHAQTSVAPPVSPSPTTNFDSASSSSAAPAAPAVDPSASATPAYVIGPDDELSIVFWREKDMSADVVVRADGKISLPLLNDVPAAGSTPLQLRDALQAAAARYIEDPVATVVVKQVKSRKVFVTGMVANAGAYSLTGPMTTLQLLAMAGGFKDFAKTKGIVIVRTTAAGTQHLKFNYRDVVSGKKGSHDIQLEPGDTVIVP